MKMGSQKFFCWNFVEHQHTKDFHNHFKMVSVSLFIDAQSLVHSTCWGYAWFMDARVAITQVILLNETNCYFTSFRTCAMYQYFCLHEQEQFENCFYIMILILHRLYFYILNFSCDISSHTLESQIVWCHVLACFLFFFFFFNHQDSIEFSFRGY